MSQADFWYVRFPDGRIVRAASTAVLRQELDAGHIPLGSTVRRSPSDEWVSLEWSEEFAELVEELAARTPPRAESRRRADKAHGTAATAADRSATVGARLHSIGVRGLLDELLAALDSTFVAKKLLLGAVAGLLLGALFALERAAWFESDSRWRTMAWPLLAAALVVFDGLTALLTRLTYIELARLHPARWSEALEGLGRLTVWLVVSQLMVGGAAGGLIVLLRWLPFWLGPAAEQPWNLSQQILAGSALAVGMLLEALLWPWFFFWWLLPPLLAVEDCTVWRGLRRWWDLLRHNLGRVFLYQTMAVGLGVLLTTPFLLVIAPLFLPAFHPPVELQDVAGGTCYLLLGLACAPLLTYWITANIFMYLSLRYGASGRR